MASLFNSTSTYDPILLLLNAENEKERNRLTNLWKDNKLAELNFIGIVGALLAGVLTSTGSWPTILPNGTLSPWPVRTCWYCGILLALLSVLTTAQQSIRLHRLAGHRDSEKNLRRLLRKKARGPNGQVLPRKAQVYTWQMAVMFLVLSVIAMLTGMFILIWSSTGKNGAAYPWWDGEAKVAVAFTIVAIFGACMFVMEQITLYTWAMDDDSQDEEVKPPPPGKGDIEKSDSII